ncbi:hypothetical protein [Dactylosporangium sp. NPDC000521]|uniref:hypothetical protein n=1 Tax=Dactylosporangium sp. NPDC000521 TaxID=3363975 RepID=UPI0036939D90
MQSFTDLSAVVSTFAAQHALIVVPAVPARDVGPDVIIEPDVLDLPGFLELAGKLCNGVLYLSARPFEPDIADRREDFPERLLEFRGQVGEIVVAFAANGLVHLWERRTEWIDEWDDYFDGIARRKASRIWSSNDEDGDAEAELRSGDEWEVQAAVLAEKLVSLPEFRSAKLADRRRVGERLLPADTDDSVGWRAVRRATERLDDLAHERYGELEARLDELAASLLEDTGYQRAVSAAARKQAAEQFLIPRADGLHPPARVRDELHARAQHLKKVNRAGAGSSLF